MSAPGRVGKSLLASAALIAVVTMAARVIGFGRLYVFSQTVGDTCLGTAYQSANTVPNVLFEVAAGGALASVLVPVLTPRLTRGELRDASRTASAVLTWSIPGLAVLAVVTAVFSPWIAAWLVDGAAAQQCPQIVDVSATLLLLFAPQIPLYGIAVLLGAVLQAQHRFLAAAMAPLVSSVVVALTYLVFAALSPAQAVNSLGQLSHFHLTVLALGTTAGVLAMALTVLPAVTSSVRLRPTLWVTPGDGRTVRNLVLAGLVTVLAQQGAVLVALKVINTHGGKGAVNLWAYAFAIFMLPVAVLAMPVVTSAFPHLVAAAERGPAALAAQSASAHRSIIAMSGAGMAVLAAASAPIAWVFVLGPVGSGDPDQLALGILACVPALLGLAVMTLGARALYAAQRTRAAAVAPALGWLTVAVATVALVPAMSPDHTVVALGLSTSIGMLTGGAVALLALVRCLGSPALVGCARSTGAAVMAAVVGGGAGIMLAAWWDARDLLGNLIAGVLVAGVAGVISVAVLRLLDGRTTAGLIGALRPRASAKGSAGASAEAPVGEQ